MRSCRGHGGETGDGIEIAGGVEGDFYVDGFVAGGMEELVVDLVAEFKEEGRGCDWELSVWIKWKGCVWAYFELSCLTL